MVGALRSETVRRKLRGVIEKHEWLTLLAIRV